MLLVWIGGFPWWILCPRMSHKCSMGLRSRLQAGHDRVSLASWWRNSNTALSLWGWVLSSMYTGRLLRGWLLKCGTAMGFLTVWIESHRLVFHWFISAGVLVTGPHLTSLSRFQSSWTNVLLGLPDLGQSLMSFVSAFFFLFKSI